MNNTYETVLSFALISLSLSTHNWPKPNSLGLSVQQQIISLNMWDDQNAAFNLVLLSYISIQEQANKYYFVVANAKFMLDEEEHFQELLSERLRLYGERNKEQDFWLVIEPKFLDKFPNITKRLRRPAVALVSTNGPWIT